MPAKTKQETFHGYPMEYKKLGDSIKRREQVPPRPYGWRQSRPTNCGTQQRTKQSFKDDCDVNLIVKRHASTGLWSHLNPTMPSYGDFSGVVELQDAIATVEAAELDFDALPAAVRAACNNDPVQFLMEVNDVDGVLALAEAGLPMADGWEPPATDEGENTTITPPATPPGEGQGVT